MSRSPRSAGTMNSICVTRRDNRGGSGMV
jgi:hypothetical protein